MPTCPKCAVWSADAARLCDVCRVHEQQQKERLGNCVECAKEGFEEAAVTADRLCAAHDVALN